MNKGNVATPHHQPLFLTNTYTKQKTIEKTRWFFCGAYGTRTRDPMRDRHVF